MHEAITTNRTTCHKSKRHLKKLALELEVLRQCPCGSKASIAEKVAAVNALCGRYSIHVLCDALSLPRGTYYNRKRREGQRTSYEINDEKLKPLIRQMPVIIAHRLTSLLTLARMTDAVHGIGPDGKAMVVVEYGDDKPVRVAQILLSVQHEAGVHIEEIQADIFAQIILPALKGMPVDDQMEVILNPSGSFVVGGPEADTGLTGRKLMVDAYGPFVSQGGGALSGKDPTKIDRTAAYMARYIAKNLVAAGIAERCRVALTYAIGMAKPMAVTVDTFGTGTYCEDDCLAAAVRHVFDLTPAGMIETLQLQQPMYARTAVGGHFGREDFPWERVDKIGLLLATID